MRFTVNATPQAIYADGLNDTVTITNNGPWTVYLDSDSSVNASSYPLPPTATIVWDAHRALWVVGAGEGSTLTLTRNSGIGDASRASTDATVLNVLNELLPASGYETAKFETSAYQTLEILLGSSTNFLPTPDGVEGYEVRIFWYSDSGLATGSTSYRVHWAIAADSPTRITTQVKGARCSIYVFSVATWAATHRLNITVNASSRAKPEGFWPLSPSTLPQGGNDSLIVTPLVGTQTEDSYSLDPWGFTPVYLSGVKKFIVVSIRITGTVTVAGILRVRDAWNTNNIYDDVAIPTGANLTTVASFRIPVTRGVLLGPATTPTGGVARLSIVWSDA